MKHFVLAFALLFSTHSLAEPVFSYYLPKEPRSLDPARLRGSGTSYLFSNLFRGLYVFDEKKGLVPEGAQSCLWKNNNLTLKCRLNPSMKWSDGKRVVAADYVRAFRHFVAPESRSVRVELLFHLKKAKEIFAGQAPVKELGIAADSDLDLTFRFDRTDPEFLYTLTNPLLVPLRDVKIKPPAKHAVKMLFNGPYIVKKWTKGRRVHLTPNHHFYRGNKNRPEAFLYFISEDSTALNLYEAGRLSFIWRLPTKLIPAYQNRPDFLRFPLARFDYLGFGGSIQNPTLRKALATSLDYEELQKVFSSVGRPGCPSLPLSFTDREVCHKFEPKKARALFNSLPTQIKTKRYQLMMSHFGGGSNRTTAQWLQAQWKKNLGIQVDILQIEQKYFLKRIKNSPPDIFRKGVGLLKPTCTAALQTFHSSSHENYIRWSNADYDQLIEQLSFETSKIRRKHLCRRGVEMLLSRHALIPMGRMHFSFLADPSFKGWKVNSLNHLDLAELRFSASDHVKK